MSRITKACLVGAAMPALAGAAKIVMSDMTVASNATDSTTCAGAQGTVFAVEPTNYKIFNDYLTDADLAGAATDCANRGVHDVCRTTPAIGSGMNFLGCDDTSCKFVGITDRGPNGDCGDMADAGMTTAATSGKAFPVPKFSPTITHFTLDTTGNKVTIDSTLYLKDKDGNPVTGVSNNAQDDAPFNAQCAASIPYDESGLDTEGVQVVETSSGTKYYIICEEYRPSVAVVGMDGTVLMRYIPKGESLPNAKYDISAILNPALPQRRKNRGFEGIACNQRSDDGYVADRDILCWVFLQSPIKTTSYIHRIVELKMNDPLSAEVSAEYVWAGTKTPKDSAGGDVSGTMWTNAANLPKDLKVSAGFWLKDKQVAVLERAKSQVLYWNLDLSQATDVKAHAANLNSTDVEDLLADTTAGAYQDTLSSASPAIAVPTKTLIADSATMQGWSLSSKQEGFAIIDHALVTVDDNDFGLEENPASRVAILHLNEGCVPHYEAKPSEPSTTSAASGLRAVAALAFAALAAAW